MACRPSFRRVTRERCTRRTRFRWSWAPTLGRGREEMDGLKHGCQSPMGRKQPSRDWTGEEPGCPPGKESGCRLGPGCSGASSRQPGFAPRKSRAALVQLVPSEAATRPWERGGTGSGVGPGAPTGAGVCAPVLRTLQRAGATRDMGLRPGRGRPAVQRRPPGTDPAQGLGGRLQGQHRAGEQLHGGPSSTRGSVRFSF